MHEHGLDDDVTVEEAQLVDDVGGTIGATGGAVDEAYVGIVDRIEFLDIVVYLHQRLTHLGTMQLRGVAQHRYARVGAIAVAQGDGGVDDFGEMGMGGGFAVAGKGKHVGTRAIICHRLQLPLERRRHFGDRRTRCAGLSLMVVSTLTVDAVEGTVFAVGGHEVDAHREAQTATVNRAVNGRIM